MELSLSTELATRAFDADAAFSAALAEFQKETREESIVADARRAASYGFAWFARPSEVGHFQVVLRHQGGAEISADGKYITATLAGLLGHPLVHDVAVVCAQASESKQEVSAFSDDERAAAWARLEADIKAAKTAGPPLVKPKLEIAPAPSPAQLAAESLAAATGGAVVAEVAADPEPDPTQSLTDEQKAVCIEMIKALTTDQRKAFTISFRDAFRVPKEAKVISPLITQVRHMEFCDRWSIEAVGKVAP